MLSTKTPHDLAVALIEQGALEDVRAALPQLRAEATAQAGPKGVRLALQEWYPVFPQPQRSEPDWILFYQGYTAVCGAQPKAALRAALKAWAQKGDSQFLPKPGELRALAASIPTVPMKLLSRAQAAIRAADDEAERLRIESDIALRNTTAAEQVTAVTTMLSQYERESKAGRDRNRRILQRGIKNADSPASDYRMPPGKTAEGSALTPQMLRHLGRPVPTPSAQVEAHRNDDDAPPSEMI